MSQITIGSDTYTMRKLNIGGNKIEYIFTAPDLPSMYSPRVTLSAQNNKSKTAAIVQVDIIVPSPKKDAQGRYSQTKDVLRKHVKVYLPMAVSNTELGRLLEIESKAMALESIASVVKTGLLTG